MNKNDINLDPAKREWMYDGNGNKVYKDDYTKEWVVTKTAPPPKLNESEWLNPYGIYTDIIFDWVGFLLFSATSSYFT